MNHSPKPITKVLMLIICLMLMLTSCSLLPTNLTDVITGLTSSEGGTVTISREEYEELKQYQQLAEMMEIVDQFYYQEPSHEDMLDGACMGLLYGLDDPYTFY